MKVNKLKRTLINKYNGWKIYYKDGQFMGEKRSRTPIERDKEKYIIEQIDSDINQKSQKKAEEKRKIELEKSTKDLSKIRIQLDFQEFNDMVNALNKYTCEPTFTINKGILSCIGMDPANVCMFYQNMKYKGTQILFKFCLNSQNLVSFFKSAKLFSTKKENSIIIKFSAKKKDEIYIHISNSFGSIKLPCIENEEREQKIPELKFSTKLKLSRIDFYKLINVADRIGETTRFISSNKVFKIISDMDNIEYETPHYKCIGEDAIVKYSLEYLKKPYFKGKEELTLQFSKDYPLKITDEKGNWLILAPRVEGD